MKLLNIFDLSRSSWLKAAMTDIELTGTLIGLCIGIIVVLLDVLLGADE